MHTLSAQRGRKTYFKYWLSASSLLTEMSLMVSKPPNADLLGGMLQMSPREREKHMCKKY